MFRFRQDIPHVHALLDRLGVSPRTGHVAAPLGATQKQAADELARHMGISAGTAERLVTGKLIGSGTPAAEMERVSHYLKGALDKPSTQADPARLIRIDSLHRHSLRARKYDLEGRMEATRAAAGARVAEKATGALTLADRHLDEAERHLGAVAHSRRGASRDRDIASARTALMTAQNHLREARALSGEIDTTGVQAQVQGRALTLFRDLKALR